MQKEFGITPIPWGSQNVSKVQPISLLPKQNAHAKKPKIIGGIEIFKMKEFQKVDLTNSDGYNHSQILLFPSEQIANTVGTLSLEITL